MLVLGRMGLGNVVKGVILESTQVWELGQDVALTSIDKLKDIFLDDE